MQAKPSRVQEGVLRVNCIDCLDRTNVVQSMFARHLLPAQLAAVGCGSGNNFLVNLEAGFQGLWADHADVLSIQYSGTGALKTDFTRTGKRTWQGLLRDGWNSACRYAANNFSDGAMQDGLDLLLGHYLVSPAEGLELISPLASNAAQLRLRSVSCRRDSF